MGLGGVVKPIAARFAVAFSGKLYVAGEPFAVAGEAGRECMLPSVAAGPDGSCLVVYSELRGVHDVKVLARVVK